MEKLKRFEKNTLITLLAFFVPALIMLLIFIKGEYAPFGKVSILVADMRVQFVDYIGYMKSIIRGDNDLFYTFSKTFGGDMMGFAAYYLFNPFYLILLLFGNDLLPQGITIMMILICGFMGLNFHLMLRAIWGNRFSSLIFSTAYAMMGFNMAYINCIHYFFSVMMLPLVILGLYRMMTNRRPSGVYIAAASLSIISNYYIGYMIMIFTAAFFLCFMASGAIEYADWRDRMKNAWTVLYSTLLAVGISAFSLLSVLFSLQGQKKAIIKGGLILGRKFNILEFFSGLYVGAFRGNISDGLPIIYCGITGVLFVFLYFANSTIKIRQKICACAMFAFLIIGYWIDALNVAWHGFANPIGFPYRNSFLFSFLMLFIGYVGFVNIREGFKKRNANIIVLAFAIYSFYLYRTGSAYVDKDTLLLTYLILAVGLILAVSMNEKNRYIVPAIAGFFVLQMADSFYNGIMSIDAYFEEEQDDGTYISDKFDEEQSLAAFSDYINSTGALVKYVNDQDSSMFRMDKLYRRTHNDPMMFAYNGLSHFSSCETEDAKTFMGRMGFRNNENWAFYGNASTSFADCFMGLKYQISQYDETAKPYKWLYSDGVDTIFTNPYALPLGFGMNESAKYINMAEKDPFKLQNSIASHFTNTRYQIYRPVKVADVKLNNVTEEDHVYTQIDPSKEASVEYELAITSSNFIYMYFDAPKKQHATLFINGDDKGEYFDDYAWSVCDCGYFKPGETVSVRFELEDNSIEIDDAYFYYESKKVLKAWYKDAVATHCNVSKLSSSHLNVKANASNVSDYIVFSIPYDDDWRVKVDGKKVKPEKIMDALMAVKIPEGEHEIDLRYIPNGIVIGGPITLLCGLITAFILFGRYIKIARERSAKKSEKQGR